MDDKLSQEEIELLLQKQNLNGIEDSIVSITDLIFEDINNSLNILDYDENTVEEDDFEKFEGKSYYITKLDINELDYNISIFFAEKKLIKKISDITFKNIELHENTEAKIPNVFEGIIKSIVTSESIDCPYTQKVKNIDNLKSDETESIINNIRNSNKYIELHYHFNIYDIDGLLIQVIPITEDKNNFNNNEYDTDLNDIISDIDNNNKNNTNSNYENQIDIQPAFFQSFEDEVENNNEREDISLILDVPLEITVELGRANKKVREILELSPGSIVELDKMAGEPIDILVNGKVIAKGEVVVVDENFGVRIIEIVDVNKRL